MPSGGNFSDFWHLCLCWLVVRGRFCNILIDIFASGYYGNCLCFEVLGRYYGKSLKRLLFWPYIFSLVFSFLENRGKTFWGKWGKHVFRGKYSTHPSTVRVHILCKSLNVWSWLVVLTQKNQFLACVPFSTIFSTPCVLYGFIDFGGFHDCGVHPNCW